MKPTVCEECQKPPDWRGLQEHHVVFRSHGGKEGKTILLCGKCHAAKHGIKEVQSEPQWNKESRTERI